MHVPVNNFDFEKIYILEYALGEGVIEKHTQCTLSKNFDNCERPLMLSLWNTLSPV